MSIKKMRLDEDLFLQNTGIADLLIDRINSKWDSISNFNSMITNLEAEDFNDMIPVIQTILDDEHNHIGQLQQLLELISPGTAEIESGKNDAIETIDADSVTTVVDESLKNKSNIARNNQLIKEDMEDGIGYFVSFYEESPVEQSDEQGEVYYTSDTNLIKHEDFDTLIEAIDYLESLHDDLVSNGYEQITDEFYLKRSKYTGQDKFVVIETELGSEESLISDEEEEFL